MSDAEMPWRHVTIRMPRDVLLVATEYAGQQRRTPKDQLTVIIEKFFFPERFPGEPLVYRGPNAPIETIKQGREDAAAREKYERDQMRSSSWPVLRQDA